MSAEYLDGITRAEEWRGALTPEFMRFVASGNVKRIVFSGMGCSAIVSEVIRGYLSNQGADLSVYVLNDASTSTLIPQELLDDKTLLILSSYSGHSAEPMQLYQAQIVPKEQTLVLASGGPLAEVAIADGISVAYWELTKADREYPLFHVPQYFAILMTILSRLELVDFDAPAVLGDLHRSLAPFIENYDRREAHKIADSLEGANIVMVAAPLWHEALLKLAKMHFNEIAMVPATRNLLHEFCHSEVAIFTDPLLPQALLLFADTAADPYSTTKSDRAAELVAARTQAGKAVRVARIEVDSSDFLPSFFRALFTIQQVVLTLGHRRSIDSTDLISSAAGNPWYSTAAVSEELVP